jgi:hypothetical protein
MGLGSDFRHAQRLGIVPPATDSTPDTEVEKWRPKGPRRVRTMRGAKIFGQPIGTIITRDMVERARRSGKLQAAGERAYGHYAPAKPSAPARGAKAPAKPARAGARAAAKAPAPKARAAAPAKGGKSFEDSLKGTSYKQVRQMIADLQDDESLSDAEFDKRLNALLARGRQLRPDKDHGTPPAKREAKAPPKPAAKKPEAKRPAPKARTDFGQGPAYDPEDQHAQDVLGDFVDAISGARNEQELDIITRYLGKEKGLSRDERADIVSRIQSKRRTLKPSQVNPTADAPKAEPKKTWNRAEAKAKQQAKVDAAREQRRNDHTPAAIKGERAFMRFRSKINALAQAAAEGTDVSGHITLLQTEIDSSKYLTPGLKDNLYDQLKDAKTAKPRRSSRYDTIAEKIDHAGSLLDGKAVFREIDKDLAMDMAERKALMKQLAQRMRDIGEDPLKLSDPEVDWDDPDIGRDWDTLPTKVKPPVGKVLPEKWRAMLHERRKVLRGVAERIRAAEMKDPDNTPAGKQIGAGKELDRVTDPRGMLAVIDAHPDWFEKKTIAGGQGGAFEVLDKNTGRQFFFKETMNGQPNANNFSVEMHGEAVNEVLSGKIGNAVFGDWFPDVDFASDLIEGVQPVIRMDHLVEHAGDKPVKFEAEHRWDTPFDYDPAAPIAKGAKKVKDPKNPLAIHIFDYLTNNTDRHMGNYAEVDNGDGTVTLVAMDNGAAFSGFDSFINSRGTQIPGKFVDEPESIGYAEWGVTYTDDGAMFARPRFMAAEVAKAYDDHGLSPDRLRKDADAIIKQFQSMDLDAMIADLHARFPNMPDYERAHMENATRIFKSRLQNVTGRDVTNLVTGVYYEPEGAL